MNVKKNLKNDTIEWRLKLGSLICLLESLSILNIVCRCSHFQNVTASRKWTWSPRKHPLSTGFMWTEIPWVVGFDLGVIGAAPVGIHGSHIFTSETRLGLAFSSLPRPGWNPILSETCERKMLAGFSICVQRLYLLVSRVNKCSALVLVLFSICVCVVSQSRVSHTTSSQWPRQTLPRGILILVSLWYQLITCDILMLRWFRIRKKLFEQMRWITYNIISFFEENFFFY